MVRAIINVALVLATSKGLFSTFALAVVAPLAQLPMRDENSAFRVDMYFGVVVVGVLLSFSGVTCGMILANPLSEGVPLKAISCTLITAILCSAGARPHIDHNSNCLSEILLLPQESPCSAFQ